MNADKSIVIVIGWEERLEGLSKSFPKKKKVPKDWELSCSVSISKLKDNSISSVSHKGISLRENVGGGGRQI